MTKYRQKPHWKITAAAVALCYSLTTHAAYAAPLQAEGGRWKADAPSTFDLPPSTALVLPSDYGTVEAFHQGKTSQSVIYIQDAHDSLEAQQNIARMILHLVRDKGVRTVFEEGYEGPVPTDRFFGFIQDPVLREKTAFHFLDQLKIGGAEYAHINRSTEDGVRSTEQLLDTRSPVLRTDFELIGADSLKLHRQNVAWYRKTARHRTEIEKDLTVLETRLLRLVPKQFPPEVRDWLKEKRRSEQAKLDFTDYAQRLEKFLPVCTRGAACPEYPELARFWKLLNDKTVLSNKAADLSAVTLYEEVNRLEKNLADYYLRDPVSRRTFGYLEHLELLRRLGRLEIHFAEYQALREALQRPLTLEIAEFLNQETRKPAVLSKRWERHLKSALKFYETAGKRDTVIEQALLAYSVERIADRKPESLNAIRYPLNASILVYGGFHRENIEEILKRNDFTYWVVAPKMNETDARSEKQYQKLMEGNASKNPQASRPLTLFESESPFAVHQYYDTVLRSEVRKAEINSEVFRAGVGRIKEEIRQAGLRPSRLIRRKIRYADWTAPLHRLAWNIDEAVWMPIETAGFLGLGHLLMSHPGEVRHAAKLTLGQMQHLHHELRKLGLRWSQAWEQRKTANPAGILLNRSEMRSEGERPWWEPEPELQSTHPLRTFKFLWSQLWFKVALITFAADWGLKIFFGWSLPDPIAVIQPPAVLTLQTPVYWFYTGQSLLTGSVQLQLGYHFVPEAYQWLSLAGFGVIWCQVIRWTTERFHSSKKLNLLYGLTVGAFSGNIVEELLTTKVTDWLQINNPGLPQVPIGNLADLVADGVMIYLVFFAARALIRWGIRAMKDRRHESSYFAKGGATSQERSEMRTKSIEEIIQLLRENTDWKANREVMLRRFERLQELSEQVHELAPFLTPLLAVKKIEFENSQGVSSQRSEMRDMHKALGLADDFIRAGSTLADKFKQQRLQKAKVTEEEIALTARQLKDVYDALQDAIAATESQQDFNELADKFLEVWAVHKKLKTNSIFLRGVASDGARLEGQFAVFKEAMGMCEYNRNVTINYLAVRLEDQARLKHLPAIYDEEEGVLFEVDPALKPQSAHETETVGFLLTHAQMKNQEGPEVWQILRRFTDQGVSSFAQLSAAIESLRFNTKVPLPAKPAVSLPDLKGRVRQAIAHAMETYNTMGSGILAVAAQVVEMEHTKQEIMPHPLARLFYEAMTQHHPQNTPPDDAKPSERSEMRSAKDAGMNLAQANAEINRLSDQASVFEQIIYEAEEEIEDMAAEASARTQPIDLEKIKAVKLTRILPALEAEAPLLAQAETLTEAQLNYVMTEPAYAGWRTPIRDLVWQIKLRTGINALKQAHIHGKYAASAAQAIIGFYEKAIPVFEKAKDYLSATPDILRARKLLVDAHVDLGIFYEEHLKDLTQAAEHLQAAITEMQVMQHKHGRLSAKRTDRLISLRQRYFRIQKQVQDPGLSRAAPVTPARSELREDTASSAPKWLEKFLYWNSSLEGPDGFDRAFLIRHRNDLLYLKRRAETYSSEHAGWLVSDLTRALTALKGQLNDANFRPAVHLLLELCEEAKHRGMTSRSIFHDIPALSDWVTLENLLAVGRILLDLERELAAKIEEVKKQDEKLADRYAYFFHLALRMTGPDLSLETLKETGSALIEAGPQKWHEWRSHLETWDHWLRASEKLLDPTTRHHALAVRMLQGTLRDLRSIKTEAAVYRHDPNPYIRMKTQTALDKASELKLKVWAFKTEIETEQAAVRAREKAYAQLGKRLIPVMKRMEQAYGKVLGRSRLQHRHVLGNEPGIASVTPEMNFRMQMRQAMTLEMRLENVLDFDGVITVDEENALNHEPRILSAFNMLMAHENAHGLNTDANAKEYRIIKPAFRARAFKVLGTPSEIRHVANETGLDRLAYEIATRIYMNPNAAYAVAEPTVQEKAALSFRDLMIIFLDYAATERGQQSLKESYVLNAARFLAQTHFFQSFPASEIRDSVQQELQRLNTQLRKAALKKLKTRREQEAFRRLIRAYGRVFANTQLAILSPADLRSEVRSTEDDSGAFQDFPHLIPSSHDFQPAAGGFSAQFQNDWRLLGQGRTVFFKAVTEAGARLLEKSEDSGSVMLKFLDESADRMRFRLLPAASIHALYGDAALAYTRYATLVPEDRMSNAERLRLIQVKKRFINQGRTIVLSPEIDFGKPSSFWVPDSAEVRAGGKTVKVKDIIAFTEENLPLGEFILRLYLLGYTRIFFQGGSMANQNAIIESLRHAFQKTPIAIWETSGRSMRSIGQWLKQFSSAGPAGAALLAHDYWIGELFNVQAENWNAVRALLGLTETEVKSRRSWMQAFQQVLGRVHDTVQAVQENFSGRRREVRGFIEASGNQVSYVMNAGTETSEPLSFVDYSRLTPGLQKHFRRYLFREMRRWTAFQKDNQIAEKGLEVLVKETLPRILHEVVKSDSSKLVFALSESGHLEGWIHFDAHHALKVPGYPEYVPYIARVEVAEWNKKQPEAKRRDPEMVTRQGVGQALLAEAFKAFGWTDPESLPAGEAYLFGAFKPGGELQRWFGPLTQRGISDWEEAHDVSQKFLLKGSARPKLEAFLRTQHKWIQDLQAMTGEGKNRTHRSELRNAHKLDRVLLVQRKNGLHWIPMMSPMLRHEFKISDIVTAESAEDALRILEQHRGDFDLVIATDLVTDTVSHKLYEQLRNTGHSSVPFIMLTQSPLDPQLGQRMEEAEKFLTRSDPYFQAINADEDLPVSRLRNVLQKLGFLRSQETEQKEPAAAVQRSNPRDALLIPQWHAFGARKIVILSGKLWMAQYIQDLLKLLSAPGQVPEMLTPAGSYGEAAEKALQEGADLLIAQGIFGTHLLERMRNIPEEEKPPVLFISGDPLTVLKVLEKGETPYVLNMPFDLRSLLSLLAALAASEKLRRETKPVQLKNLSGTELELAVEAAAAIFLEHDSHLGSDKAVFITPGQIYQLRHLLLTEDWDGLREFLKRFTVSEDLIRMATDGTPEDRQSLFRILEAAVQIKMLARKEGLDELYSRAHAEAVRLGFAIGDALRQMFAQLRQPPEGEEWKYQPLLENQEPVSAQDPVVRYARLLIQRFTALEDEGAVLAQDAILAHHRKRQALYAQAKQDLEGFEARMLRHLQSAPDAGGRSTSPGSDAERSELRASELNDDEYHAIWEEIASFPEEPQAKNIIAAVKAGNLAALGPKMRQVATFSWSQTPEEKWQAFFAQADTLGIPLDIHAQLRRLASLRSGQAEVQKAIPAEMTKPVPPDIKQPSAGEKGEGKKGKKQTSKAKPSQRGRKPPMPKPEGPKDKPENTRVKLSELTSETPEQIQALGAKIYPLAAALKKLLFKEGEYEEPVEILADASLADPVSELAEASRWLKEDDLDRDDLLAYFQMMEAAWGFLMNVQQMNRWLSGEREDIIMQLALRMNDQVPADQVRAKLAAIRKVMREREEAQKASSDALGRSELRAKGLGSLFDEAALEQLATERIAEGKSAGKTYSLEEVKRELNGLGIGIQSSGDALADELRIVVRNAWDRLEKPGQTNAVELQTFLSWIQNGSSQLTAHQRGAVRGLISKSLAGDSRERLNKIFESVLHFSRILRREYAEAEGILREIDVLENQAREIYGKGIEAGEDGAGQRRKAIKRLSKLKTLLQSLEIKWEMLFTRLAENQYEMSVLSAEEGRSRKSDAELQGVGLRDAHPVYPDPVAGSASYDLTEPAHDLARSEIRMALKPGVDFASRPFGQTVPAEVQAAFRRWYPVFFEMSRTAERPHENKIDGMIWDAVQPLRSVQRDQDGFLSSRASIKHSLNQAAQAYAALKTSKGTEAAASLHLLLGHLETFLRMIRQVPAESLVEPKHRSEVRKVAIRKMLDKLRLEIDPVSGRLRYRADFQPVQLRSSITLVRHGETQLMTHEGGLAFQGNVDEKVNRLSKAGRRQARAKAKVLAKQFRGRIQNGRLAVFSSLLSRAHDTAKAFTKRVKNKTGVSLPITRRKGLREWNTGAWSNLNETQILKRLGIRELHKVQRHREKLDSLMQPPLGESFLEFLYQAQQELKALDAHLTRTGKDGLAFTHKGKINAFRVLTRDPAMADAQGLIDWRSPQVEPLDAITLQPLHRSEMRKVLSQEEIENAIRMRDKSKIKRIHTEIKAGYERFWKQGDDSLIDKYHSLIRRGKIGRKEIEILERHGVTFQWSQLLFNELWEAEAERQLPKHDVQTWFASVPPDRLESFFTFFKFFVLVHHSASLSKLGMANAAPWPKAYPSRETVIQIFTDYFSSRTEWIDGEALIEELDIDEQQAGLFSVNELRALVRMQQPITAQEKGIFVYFGQLLNAKQYEDAIELYRLHPRLLRKYLSYLSETHFAPSGVTATQKGYETALTHLGSLFEHGLKQGQYIYFVCLALEAHLEHIALKRFKEIVSQGQSEYWAVLAALRSYLVSHTLDFRTLRDPEHRKQYLESLKETTKDPEHHFHGLVTFLIETERTQRSEIRSSFAVSRQARTATKNGQTSLVLRSSAVETDRAEHERSEMRSVQPFTFQTALETLNQKQGVEQQRAALWFAYEFYGDEVNKIYNFSGIYHKWKRQGGTMISEFESLFKQAVRIIHGYCTIAPSENTLYETQDFGDAVQRIFEHTDKLDQVLQSFQTLINQPEFQARVNTIPYPKPEESDSYGMALQKRLTIALERMDLLKARLKQALPVKETKPADEAERRSEVRKESAGQRVNGLAGEKISIPVHTQTRKPANAMTRSSETPWVMAIQSQDLESMDPKTWEELLIRAYTDRKTMSVLVLGGSANGSRQRVLQTAGVKVYEEIQMKQISLKTPVIYFGSAEQSFEEARENLPAELLKRIPKDHAFAIYPGAVSTAQKLAGSLAEAFRLGLRQKNGYWTDPENVWAGKLIEELSANYVAVSSAA